MDILPYLLLVLFVVFLVGIVLIFRRLRSREGSFEAPGESSNRSPSAASKSPTASSRQTGHKGHGLETMRLAVEQMDTNHIENLLEMGATLKPGAEEVFREELERRRAAAADSDEEEEAQ